MAEKRQMPKSSVTSDSTALSWTIVVSEFPPAGGGGGEIRDLHLVEDGRCEGDGDDGDGKAPRARGNQPGAQGRVHPPALGGVDLHV